MQSLKQKYQSLMLACLQGMAANTSIDTVGNMICLGPQLHYWWLKGFFGLEPMKVWSEPSLDGTAKWSIQIRFHWLKKTYVPSLTLEVDFPQDPITMIQKRTGVGLLEIVNATGQQVQSGQVFTITADSRDE
ncbi:hypothetical protein CGRA01v4_01982 [Colletotrichum graminicola]|nr:hypothetical protein CGRA01v4_01982 [Colletotrichum graminicola]